MADTKTSGKTQQAAQPAAQGKAATAAPARAAAPAAAQGQQAQGAALAARPAAPAALARPNPVNDLKGLLLKGQADIAKVIPRHLTPERLTNLALMAMGRSADLQACTTISVYRAILQCAELGLEPNTPMGHAYLVPFNRNTKNPDGSWTSVKDCQLIIGYRGMIDLARRAGDLEQIEAHVVHERDTFRVRFGLDPDLTHEPCLDGDPGPARLVYMVARLKGGARHVEVMTRLEVERIQARSKGGNSGPWKTDEEEMWKKTVVRRGMKYLPMSSERLGKALEHEEEAVDGTVLGVSDAIAQGTRDATPHAPGATKTARLKAELVSGEAFASIPADAPMEDVPPEEEARLLEEEARRAEQEAQARGDATPEEPARVPGAEG